MASPASTCSVAVSSPHFEPYPIPSTVHAAHSSLPSDYQLRKVNSEPNLKMRSVQMDVSAFLAQAAFSPFLSMPSLLKSNLLASPASILDSMLDPTAISGMFTEAWFHHQT
uniref:Uncharacterized protein n=1 Tax=Parascaris equorum TaxID=6256 RepID=A0A914R9J6_PAREQ